MTRQRLKNSLLLQLGVIYTRYLVGGAFVFASLIKIKGQRFTQMMRASERKSEYAVTSSSLKSRPSAPRSTRR